MGILMINKTRDYDSYIKDFIPGLGNIVLSCAPRNKNHFEDARRVIGKVIKKDPDVMISRYIRKNDLEDYLLLIYKQGSFLL